MPFAAHALGRSHRTIRTWIRDGAVRARHTPAGGLEVHVFDAGQLSRARARRARQAGRSLPDHAPSA